MAPSVSDPHPNGTNFGVFETLSLSATVSDDHDWVDALHHQWSVSWSTSSGMHTEIVGSEPQLQWAKADSIDFNSEGRWDLELRLQVTDSHDNTGTDFVTLYTIFIE